MKVVDLFAGAGGMSEGFKQAGFFSSVATDFDEMAAKTFTYNHPHVPFITKDVREISSREVLDASGATPGDFAVICGGPPCQMFSLAGPRIIDDPRNQLFLEFVRLVDDLEPDFFVFENVYGLLTMQKGQVHEAILRAFSELGYNINWRIMNTADYGVPQARPRYIIVGSKPEFDYRLPDPEFFPKVGEEQTLFSTNERAHLTVWDAISDLPEIFQGEGNEELFHSGSYDNSYQTSRRGHRYPGRIFNHRATGHSERIVERYAAMPQGGGNRDLPKHLQTKKNNIFRLHQNKPSRTVTCNHRTDLLHPTLPRGTTVREAARLQSFDDDYRFFGNLTRKAAWLTQDDQVGNAVPPLFARAIAESIRQSMSNNGSTKNHG